MEYARLALRNVIPAKIKLELALISINFIRKLPTLLTMNVRLVMKSAWALAASLEELVAALLDR